MAKRPEPANPAGQAFRAGCALVSTHPLTAPLWHHIHVERSDNSRCPDNGWACVSPQGIIYAHPRRRGEPEEWAYVLTHCLLHLGFLHPTMSPKQGGGPLQALEWNLACCCTVARFQAGLRLGRVPREMRFDIESSASSEA